VQKFDFFSSIFPEFQWHEWKFTSIPTQNSIREFLDELGSEVGIKNMKEWYSHTSYRLFSSQLCGNAFLRHVDYSPSQLLIQSYPQHDWEPWRFSKVPFGFWREVTHQRAYIRSLSSVPQGLYDLNPRSVNSSVLNMYNFSLSQAVQVLFPELLVFPWKFGSLPQGFWYSKDNRKQYICWLGGKLGFEKMEDWYRVKQTSFLNNGASSLLTMYNSSPSAIIKSERNLFFLFFFVFDVFSGVFSYHPWQMWQFSVTPKHNWNDMVKQREYIEWLATNISLSIPEEFISITTQMIGDNFGRGLIQSQYGQSSRQLLLKTLPELPILALCYSMGSVYKRMVFDHVALRLSIQSPLDIMQIQKEDILAFGVHNVQNFSSDRTFAFIEFFPLLESVHYSLFHTNSPSLPSTHPLHYLISKLKIRKMEDWYRISLEQLRQSGIKNISSFSTFQKDLKKHYPDHSWDEASFLRVKKASQRELKLNIATAFPRVEIVEEFKASEKENNSKIELDIYLPSLSVAFEYQGNQHYVTDKNVLSDLSSYVERDLRKREVCSRRGITLLEVPFWCDRGSSYSTALFSKRPDLSPIKFERYESKQPC